MKSLAMIPVKKNPKTGKKKAPKSKSSSSAKNAEQLLLTQSLEKELKLNKKTK